MLKKTAILAVLLLASTGCATTNKGSDPDSMSKEAITKLIKDATNENKKAASMGSLWRDSNKMIKKAMVALDKGDTKKASKLAKTALAQGKLGQLQAKDQKNAGPWLF